MVEDLKKGQPEVNTLDHKKGSQSETEDLHQTLKNKRPEGTKEPRQICPLL
jgi:hypothetical protein